LALFSQPFRSGGDRVCCGLLSSGAHYAETVIPVLTPTEARALDAAAPVPVSELISRAGAALARSAVEMLGGTYGRTVNVIAGPGNNGADARDAAARLSQRGMKVRIWDPAECPQVLPAADLVIDGAYGTGFRGSWEAPQVGNTPVLAVDIPSGLDALTGKVTGTVLAATRTVTFAAGKPGVYLGEGPQVCGEVVVADIGLDVSGASIDVVTPHDVAERWPQRPRHAHKWSTAVRMIAGSSGMTGAAHLASAAAMRSGAGIVHLSSPGIETDSLLEVVGRSIPGFDWSAAVLADLHRFGALVIGPGLGRGEHTAPSVVDTITQALCPVVIDGDGLFAVTWNAQGPGAVLRSRRGATVLTPHDGEFASARRECSRAGSDRCGSVLGRRDRCCGPPQRADHGGCGSSRPGPVGHQWVRPFGHCGHRRCVGGDHRHFVGRWGDGGVGGSDGSVRTRRSRPARPKCATDRVRSTDRARRYASGGFR
jgi:ADP-dependent NAD(P)H-hydrate dehydratase / NAD(P)H-hydrate epimerase